MLFNSLSFLFLFLPPVFLGFYLIGKHRILFGCLASLVFYAIWRPANLFLLIPSICINYMIGMRLLKKPSFPLLCAGVAANIGMVGYFKYAGFFMENWDALTGAHFAIPSIVLPLGISFFTLHQICYLVDSYHRKTRPTPFSHYLLYITFFPQLIAGPIVRFTEVMDQYDGPRFGKFDIERFTRGLFLFCIGLSKKVLIADSFAMVASPIFNAAHAGFGINAAQGWAAALSYSLQIYFDFSGYSDMALGLAWMFGIVLPVNFNSPYQATSIVEFWRRWHMTLSRFLRDYLYIPLGGNRHGRIRRLMNLVIVMLIGGLWHGAAWTFVIWGGLHGAYLLINHAWRQFVPENDQPGLRQIPGILLTCFCVMIAWVFFRADSVHGAVAILRAMCSLGSGDTATGVDINTWLMAAAAAVIIWFAPNSNELAERFGKMRLPELGQWRQVGFALGLFTGLAVFLIFTGTKSEFIYFQF